MTEFEFASLRVLKKRIAVALWNREEGERIIAMRVFALFSRRGQWHGLGLDDWREAKLEISLAEDEVVLSESDERIDISISARAGTHHLEPLSGEVLVL